INSVQMALTNAIKQYQQALVAKPFDHSSHVVWKKNLYLKFYGQDCRICSFFVKNNISKKSPNSESPNIYSSKGYYTK
ncbi:MAG: hypothetical protein AAGG80_06905, partial [Pseudomonadota bacterium]